MASATKEKRLKNERDSPKHAGYRSQGPLFCAKGMPFMSCKDEPFIGERLFVCFPPTFGDMSHGPILPGLWCLGSSKMTQVG